jgi:hypothetical protein
MISFTHRSICVALVLSFALAGHGLAAHRVKISDLANGELTGNVYLNSALGIRMEFPTGWVVSTEFEDAAWLQRVKTDGPPGECLKGLLTAYSQQQPGRTAAQEVFAMDSSCFSGLKFPKSEKDKKGVIKFAEKIIKAFGHAPFFSDNGADIDANRENGVIIVRLTGNQIVDAPKNGNQATEKPARVYMALSVAESKGYWLAWAGWTSDPSGGELNKVNLQLEVAK